MNAKKVIILAEDDPGIIEVVTIILREEGYEVVIAEEKDTIFERCKKKKPHLIFLDISLSGEDGRVIAKELKESDALRGIPLIMLSANNEIEQVAESSGADGYLQKPFEIDELLGIAKKYLR